MEVIYPFCGGMGQLLIRVGKHFEVAELADGDKEVSDSADSSGFCAA